MNYWVGKWNEGKEELNNMLVRGHPASGWLVCMGQHVLGESQVAGDGPLSRYRHKPSLSQPLSQPTEPPTTPHLETRHGHGQDGTLRQGRKYGHICRKSSGRVCVQNTYLIILDQQINSAVNSSLAVWKDFFFFILFLWVTLSLSWVLRSLCNWLLPQMAHRPLQSYEQWKLFKFRNEFE